MQHLEVISAEVKFINYLQQLGSLWSNVGRK